MPNNKDHQKSGSQGSMGNNPNSPDREFESQGQDSGFEKSGQGQQAGSSGGYGKDTGSQRNMDDDEMNTAGGREGQFSDSNRGKEAQWSPGSSRSTEE